MPVIPDKVISFNEEAIFPALPQTQKSDPCHIHGTHLDGSKIIYPAQWTVVLRDLNDATKSRVYNWPRVQRPSAADFCSDDKKFAVGDAEGFFNTVNVSNLKPVYKEDARAMSGKIREISYGNKDQWILVVGQGGDHGRILRAEDGGGAFITLKESKKGYVTGSMYPHAKPKGTAGQDQYIGVVAGDEEGSGNCFSQGDKNKGFKLKHDFERKFVTEAKYSPDGTKVLFASQNRKGLFTSGGLDDNNEHFKVISTTDVHPGGLYSGCWSPDSQYGAFGCANGTVYIHDAATGALKKEFNVSKNQIVGLYWTKDNKILTYTEEENVMRITPIDPSSLAVGETQALYGHTTPINGVVFDAANNQLYTGSSDSILVWNDKGVAVPLAGAHGGIRAMKRQGKNLVISSTDDSIKVTPMNGEKKLSASVSQPFPGLISLAVSHEGNSQAAVNETTLMVINDGKATSIALEGFQGKPSSVAISPDRSTVVVGVKAQDQFRLQFYKNSGGNLSKDGDSVVIGGGNAEAHVMEYSPDGKTLALGTSARDLQLWDPVKREVIKNGLAFHLAGVRALSWSPSGKRIATAGSDGKLIVWNMPDCGRIEQENAHIKGVGDISWATEDTLFSAGSDAAARKFKTL